MYFCPAAGKTTCSKVSESEHINNPKFNFAAPFSGFFVDGLKGFVYYSPKQPGPEGRTGISCDSLVERKK